MGKEEAKEESQSSREQSLERLRHNHRFPGPYMFKVIGDNTPDFMANVVQTVVMVLGGKVYPEVETRESSKGNHQAVTLVVRVPDAERVLAVYAELRQIVGVRLLL